MPKLVFRLRALPTETVTDSPPPRHVVDLLDRTRSSAVSTPTTLARWSRVTATSHDPCVLLDDQGRVVSLSASAGRLLGCGTDGVAGRELLPLLNLLDFDTGASAPDYAHRLAPLAVLKEGAGLVRSLLRVRHADGEVHTLDAAAAPLHDADGRLVGSLTLFASLGG
ncbi:MAG TPA: PAS domain-containing protein [Mycobacteriales bacterium]|jgi:PAS domain S-box-containing protein|nr:PAS domain-containing protein [Mycobacteriales bacterium]